MTKRTGFGSLDPNVAGAFAYVLGPLSGALLLMFSSKVVKEREGFVRFHAVQSILTFVAAAVAQLALSSLPGVRNVLSVPFVIAVFLLWAMLIVRALAGQTYKLPLVGEIAAEQLR